MKPCHDNNCNSRYPVDVEAGPNEGANAGAMVCDCGFDAQYGERDGYRTALQKALEKLGAPTTNYAGDKMVRRQYAGMIDEARTVIEDALGIGTKGGGQ